jgi:hypothetical protein
VSPDEARSAPGVSPDEARSAPDEARSADRLQADLDRYDL